jgi:hypothetical protein
MSYGGTESSPPLVEGREEAQSDIGETTAVTTRIRNNLKSFYERNFGLFLVFCAQTCGSVVCKLDCGKYFKNNQTDMAYR